MTAVDPGTATTVEATLDGYHRLTQAAMEEHLCRDGPATDLWEIAADYPRRAGKAIRPALCLATCVAFGGRLDDALPSAVAIELLHNAFLVHDDIEDGSELRRGRPTLHTEHGVAVALNAGSALALLAAAPLRENRSRLGARLAAEVGYEFARMSEHTVEGQAIELTWRASGPADLSPDDYLDLIMRKTCWYTTIHPLRVGALIGSWGRADLDPLVRFGFYLGAAFQIRDDILNLAGEEDRYGKEALGDLYEGKRTLMLNHLLTASVGDERVALLAYLRRSREERGPEEVAAVLDAMRRHGSIEFAAAFARGIAAAAHDAFEVAFAEVARSPERDFVEAMIPWMLERVA